MCRSERLKRQTFCKAFILSLICLLLCYVLFCFVMLGLGDVSKPAPFFFPSHFLCPFLSLYGSFVHSLAMVLFFLSKLFTLYSHPNSARADPPLPDG